MANQIEQLRSDVAYMKKRLENLDKKVTRLLQISEEIIDLGARFPEQRPFCEACDGTTRTKDADGNYTFKTCEQCA